MQQVAPKCTAQHLSYLMEVTVAMLMRQRVKDMTRKHSLKHQLQEMCLGQFTKNVYGPNSKYTLVL